MDTIAQALVKAAANIEDGRVDAFRAERYAGWKGDLGQAVHGQEATLASIADLAISRDLVPARQEWLEKHGQPLLMLDWAVGDHWITFRVLQREQLLRLQSDAGYSSGCHTSPGCSAIMVPATSRANWRNKSRPRR